MSLQRTIFHKEKVIQRTAPSEKSKNVSQPNYFNKNIDTSNNTAPQQAIISLHIPKVNSFLFEDPYDHINPMENTHEDTHLINTTEQYIEDT